MVVKGRLICACIHIQMSSPKNNPPQDSSGRTPNSSPKSASRRRSSSGSPRSRSRDRQGHLHQQPDRTHQPQDEQRRDRGYSDRPVYRGEERGHFNRIEEDRSHFKTRICPLFEKGECKKGQSCSFAHGEKELRGLPNFKKTRLCIPFKNGQCPRSSADCNYAHGEAEIKKLAYDYFPQKRREEQKPYQHRGYERPERNHRDAYRDPYREGPRDTYRGHDEYRSRDSQRGPPRDYPKDDRREHDYRREDYRREENRREGEYRRDGDYKKERREGEYRREQEYPSYAPYASHYNNAYMYPYAQEGYAPPIQQGYPQPPPSQPPQGNNYQQFMGNYDYYGYYPQGYNGFSNPPTTSNNNNSSSKPPPL